MIGKKSNLIKTPGNTLGAYIYSVLGAFAEFLAVNFMLRSLYLHDIFNWEPESV